MKRVRISRLVVAGVLMLTGVLAVGGAVLGSNEAARAVEDGGQLKMSVSPPYQEIVLTPGEVYKGTITVSNTSQSEGNLKYSVSVGSYSERATEGSEDDYANPDLTSVGEYNQIMKWIDIPKPTGELVQGQKETVVYIISVPEDAPAGGQYATLIVQNDSKEQNGGDGMQIENTMQIASIIYAEVAGTTKQEAEISNNNFPSFLLQNPLTATSMVQNQGNTHTDATYTLQVWPAFGGDEICTNEENPTTEIVLPGTKRYHVETCDLGLVGVYRARQTVKIFNDVSMVEHIVVICPIWLILIVIVVILALIFWIIKKVKEHREKRI